MEFLIVAIAAGGIALLFAGVTTFRVVKSDPGNEAMRAIGDAIREGSSAFLRREYLVLVPFVVVVTGILWVLIDW
ncbi:MAG: sodium/proton-translocating pyrophosphatase, partial [Dehalococcoidia bacterium]|nr:sodium/proton-translocating pyrophosphatase [Dehalococcoidia bacterium]